MKQNIFAAFGIVVICATIVYVSFLLQHTGITIQNSGSTSASIQNSISVSGEGRVASAPDVMNVSVGVSELAPTTKEAQKQANEKLSRILAVLKNNGIEEKNVQTQHLSFMTEYDWSNNGRKLLGQRVQQNLNIKIPEIDKKPERVTGILDSLGEIDALEVNSVSFNIENKEALYTKAREEAFEKASQKAKELAKLGGVKLGAPITISSGVVEQPPIIANYARAEMGGFGGGGGSAVPAGELEVTTTVSVVFEIE